MIVITGAAGFIGSCLVSRFNKEGFNGLVLVDDFSKTEKDKNLKGKSYLEKVNRDVFFDWLKINAKEVDMIFHIGARTDTTEFDTTIFDKLNLNYTKTLWTICAEQGISLVYASSAATYGMGELGYDDNHEIVDKLKPLNPYGDSKNDFDKWALKQGAKPKFWAGLKFFNVYGPNEYHKARMASVVFHGYNQIKATGKIKLFRSHRPDFADGMQLRDFVYVKDLVEVCLFFFNNRTNSGLYNLGTGKAEPFKKLAESTFKALNLEPTIEFIDTPIDIRDKYQYFTEAKMEKLRSIGYTKPFHSLEEGVIDYVQNYLTKTASY